MAFQRLDIMEIPETGQSNEETDESQIGKKHTIEKFTLYGDEVSPPVRFAMMTASMLKMHLDFHKIELFKEENKSSFFAQINPLQKVPVLRVGENVICDSHAIATYMCDVSEGQELYPKDPLSRARVHQIMFFNSETLFPIDSFIFTEYFRGNWPVDETKIQEWYAAVDHLEYQLTQHMWLAGDQVSLADLCCMTTVSSLQILVPLLDRHIKVQQWLERLQELSCNEINSRGIERLRNFVNSF